MSDPCPIKTGWASGNHFIKWEILTWLLTSFNGLTTYRGAWEPSTYIPRYMNVMYSRAAYNNYMYTQWRSSITTLHFPSRYISKDNYVFRGPQDYPRFQWFVRRAHRTQKSCYIQLRFTIVKGCRLKSAKAKRLIDWRGETRNQLLVVLSQWSLRNSA